MKSMKRFMALLLVVVMTMALSVTAFAEAGDEPKAPEPTTETGSITIDNTVLGQSYTYYKVFDLTYANQMGADGKPNGQKTVMYMTDNANLLSVLPSESDDEAMAAAVAAYKNWKTGEDPVCPYYKGAPVDGMTDGYYVYHLWTYDTAITSDAAGRGWLMKNLDSWKTGVDSDTVTATGNTIVFGDLDLGYYLITTTNGSEVIINSTTPDVTVHDKNEQGPKGPTKVEDKVNVAGGEVVTYVSTLETANFVNNASSHEAVLLYTANDTWDAGLTFNEETSIQSVELYKMTSCTKAEYDAVTDENLKYSSGTGDSAKYYKLTKTQTFTKVAELAEEGSADNKGKYILETNVDEDGTKDDFKIWLPWASYTAVKDEKTDEISISDVNAFFPAPGLLKIKYQMTVNDEIFAKQVGTFKADNTINYKYDKEANGKYIPNNGGTNITVTVYSFGLSLRKTDTSGNPLTGAEFIIYQETLKYTEDGNYQIFTDGDNEYYLIPEHEVEGGTTVPDAYYAVEGDAEYEPEDDAEPLVPVVAETKYYAGPTSSVVYTKGVATNIKAGEEEQNYAAKWVEGKANATRLTADNSYDSMEAVGLLPGVYYVEEIKNPDCYALPKHPFKITITADGGTYEVTYDQNGNDGAAVIASGKRESDQNAFETAVVQDGINKEMPTTGGTGTVLLVTLGAVLFLGAAILLVTKKRLYNRG